VHAACNLYSYTACVHVFNFVDDYVWSGNHKHSVQGCIGKVMEGEIVTRASAARRQHFAQQSPLKAISRTTKYRLRKRKRIASESLEDCADITGVGKYIAIGYSFR